jgi:hypothetical protein
LLEFKVEEGQRGAKLGTCQQTLSWHFAVDGLKIGRHREPFDVAQENMD